MKEMQGRLRFSYYVDVSNGHYKHGTVCYRFTGNSFVKEYITGNEEFDDCIVIVYSMIDPRVRREFEIVKQHKNSNLFKRGYLANRLFEEMNIVIHPRFGMMLLLYNQFEIIKEDEP